jgi:single stranded DNA-binding protein
MPAHVIVTGFAATEPEMRFTQPRDGRDSIATCSFRIGVARMFDSSKSDFFTVVLFRQQAEYAANWVEKGALIEVQGRLQNRTYVSNGVERTVTEIVGETIKCHRRPLSSDIRQFLGKLYGAMEQNPVTKPLVGVVQGLVEVVLKSDRQPAQEEAPATAMNTANPAAAAPGADPVAAGVGAADDPLSQ